LLRPRSVVETALPVEDKPPNLPKILAGDTSRFFSEAAKQHLVGKYSIKPERVLILGEGYDCKDSELSTSFGIQIVQFLVRFKTGLLLTDHLLFDYLGEDKLTALLNRMVRADRKIIFWLNEVMHKKFQTLFSQNGFQGKIKIYKKSGGENPLSEKNVWHLFHDLLDITDCGI